MNLDPGRRLLVCYIPGLDERLLDEARTPYICKLRRSFPVTAVGTVPTTELVPSLVSGTLPHQHRVWQVSLKPEFRNGLTKGIADYIPDGLVTTLQCARHFFEPAYDLAVIPRRRRQRFDLHRFKYTRRQASSSSMNEFAGYPSVFGLLGSRSRYVFTKDFESLPGLAEALPSACVLGFLEMYALDLVQHWHLDNRAVMDDALQRTDRFVHDLHQACRSEHVTFVLLVDHGQELVTDTIPLVSTLKTAGVPETEYSYFVELASARIWFHTERARALLMDSLSGLRHTTLLDWQQMHDYLIRFEDDSFGELYVFADAGRIFFPHDFYQPLGNAFLGLIDRHQRQRFFNPVHRGNHGYLPHYPSEQGWLLVDDESLASVHARADLIDIAPSILALTGATIPDYMTGKSLFGTDRSASI